MNMTNTLRLRALNYSSAAAAALVLLSAYAIMQMLKTLFGDFPMPSLVGAAYAWLAFDPIADRCYVLAERVIAARAGSSN